LVYYPLVQDQFRRFEDMGVGVSKAAKFLRISVNTFQKWVLKAENLKPVIRFPPNCTYDIDEIQPFIGKRTDKYWVCYGWNVDLQMPIGLSVGGRMKRLNRRTICFSKSLTVLIAVLKIYCWY